MRLKEYLILEKKQRNPFNILKKRKRVREELFESNNTITIKFKKLMVIMLK